jgi:hypothetical protein
VRYIKTQFETVTVFEVISQKENNAEAQKSWNLERIIKAERFREPQPPQ